MSTVIADTRPSAIDRHALISSRRPGYGLPRNFYHDPAIHARDLARIFHRHWLVAGHVGQVPHPGDFFTLQIDTDRVIIARAQDGTLHALLNSCRHRGSEVCTETHGHARWFVCPYHAWVYGLDGSLAAARHMPESFDRAAHGLRRLALHESQGLILISFAPLRGETPLGLDDIARTLAASLGTYGWADATVAHRETYVLEANWKLSVENYVECYHCAPSHPEYSRTHALEQPEPRIAHLNAAMEARTAALGLTVGTAQRFHSDDGQEAFRCRRYALHTGVDSGSDDGRGVGPLMGQFAAYDGGATSLHLGGASFMLAYPDHGVVYRFWPLGVDRSAMELIWLVRNGAVAARDYDLQRLTWLWRVTSEADKRIIEHNAHGVASTFYEPGPLSPMENTENDWIDWYLSEIS